MGRIMTSKLFEKVQKLAVFQRGMTSGLHFSLKERIIYQKMYDKELIDVHSFPTSLKIQRLANVPCIGDR